MLAKVTVVDTAGLSEIAQVKRAMERAGLSVEVTVAHHPDQDKEHLGEAIPWIVTVTLAAPVAAFFASIGTEAGKDAWVAIKRWSRDITQASSPHRYGDVRLQDPSGFHMEIRPVALPDEAFVALAAIDWSGVEGGSLHWDHSPQVWKTGKQSIADVLGEYVPEEGDRRRLLTIEYPDERERQLFIERFFPDGLAQPPRGAP